MIQQEGPCFSASLQTLALLSQNSAVQLAQFPTPVKIYLRRLAEDC